MACIEIDDVYKFQSFVPVGNNKKLENMNKWLNNHIGEKKWIWQMTSNTSEFCPKFIKKEDAFLFQIIWMDE